MCSVKGGLLCNYFIQKVQLQVSTPSYNSVCVSSMYVVQSKHASLRKLFIREINTLVLFPFKKRKMTSMIEGTVQRCKWVSTVDPFDLNNNPDGTWI